jgi:hypothetical protein
VSLLVPGGPVTVRYDACAAMTTRPDGARHLTGLDGFRVAVEPTLFRDVTAERIAVLDASVPAAAVVPLPARDPERIPRPRERETRETAPVPPAGGGGARKSVSPGLRRLPVWFVLLVVSEVVFGAGLLIAIVQTSDSGHSAFVHLTRAILPTALVIGYTRKAYRRARRERG